MGASQSVVGIGDLTGALGGLACAAPRRPAGTANEANELNPEVLHVVARPSENTQARGSAPHTPRHAAARTHPAAARQTLTKAALSVYKGTAIEMHDAETGETKVLEDSQLISMLHLQMAQCQSAESCQLIM